MTGNLRRHSLRALLHTIIVLLVVIWITPSLGLIVTSFRPAQGVAHTGWWTIVQAPFSSAQYTLENYHNVLFEQGMLRALVNSIIITVPAVILPVIIASLASYGFAWMRFPGRITLFAMLVALLVVPLQMTFIPVLRLYNKVHLTGTFPAIWLAHTAYGLPLSTFLLHNFISRTPKDLLDSATIDGASHFGVFARIIMPLATSAIASLVIFQFIWVWNDMLLALIYVGGTPQVAPLTVKLTTMVGLRGEGWEKLTAGGIVSMAVPLAIFFSLQRYFARGLLAGSLKE